MVFKGLSAIMILPDFPTPLQIMHVFMYCFHRVHAILITFMFAVAIASYQVNAIV